MQMATSDDQKGIFVRHPVNFDPKGTITHLRACNSELLMVISGRTVVHIPLQHTNRRIEIQLPHLANSDDRVAHLHFDSGGIHALVSTVAGENIYVNVPGHTSKGLKRLKSQVISAIGWNIENSGRNETGFIVLGTVTGCLFEAEFTSSGHLSYMKELMPSVPASKGKHPIDCIQLHQCPDSAQWILMFTTDSRLYILTGPAIPPVPASTSSALLWGTGDPLNAALCSLFNDEALTRYHTLAEDRGGDKNLPSQLAVYPQSAGESPQKFLWLASGGIRMGSMKSTEPDGYEALDTEATLPYVYMYRRGNRISSHKRVDGRLDYPLDLALTEYHALLLYSDRLVAVSVLNQMIMYEDRLGKEFGVITGMTRDPISGLIWVFTSTNILRYRPTDETKYVWRIYLERGEYSKALKLTSTLNDPAPHQLVLKRKADQFITEKNFTSAAEILAESTDPFEVTVLKFMSTNDERRNGLKLFLELKLNKLTSPADKIRREMLVIWLVDLQLTELAELRRGGGPPASSKRLLSVSGSITSTGSDSAVEFNEVEFRRLRDQFHAFLCRTHVFEALCTYKEAIYKLMRTHADMESLLFFAGKLKDYITIINIQLLQERYQEALNVITAQRDNSAEFFYTYSPSLIEHIPTELVRAWIENDQKLKPAMLMPAMYRCNNKPKLIAPVLAYLKHAIERLRVRDGNLHNFLISLCAHSAQQRLLPYLESEGIDKTKVPYDVDLALRICLEQGLDRCCVHLYCVAELYDEAVDLALSKIGVDLAKKCAHLLDPSAASMDDLFDLAPSLREPKYSQQLRRGIWMRIARHVIEKDNDVASGMKLLGESGGLLTIQQLIPFFPEFTTIDDFKEPLCTSLREHSVRIQELQKEMKEAIEVAGDIRADMEKMKTKYMVIRAQDECGVCKRPTMIRPFFAFACRHFLHADCIESYMQQYLTTEQKNRFAQLREKEIKLAKMAQVDQQNVPSDGKLNDLSSKSAEVRKQMDAIIASQCPLCGPLMIDSIDKPFFTEEEYERELKTW